MGLAAVVPLVVVGGEGKGPPYSSLFDGDVSSPGTSSISLHMLERLSPTWKEREETLLQSARFQISLLAFANNGRAAEEDLAENSTPPVKGVRTYQ